MHNHTPPDDPRDASTNPSPEGDAGSVFRDALLLDTGLAVALIDSKGMITGCNPQCSGLLGHQTTNAVLRSLLTKHLAPPVADAHRQAQQHTQRHRQPVRIDGPFGDRMSLATYRPVRDGAGIAQVLVVAPWTHGRPTPANTHTVTIAPHEDHPLAKLTRRELHVLRGIAGGLSTVEIARVIHRSVKTIEGHRVTLGSKLGARNRVELARFAWKWGVEPLTRPHEPPPAQ